MGRALAAAMQAAGERAAELAGRPSWIDDAWCFQQASHAVLRVLTALRPEGEPQPPEIRLDPEVREQMGEETARRYAEAQLLVGFMVADYLLGRGSGKMYTQAEEFQAPLGPKLIKQIRRKELRK